MRWLRCVRRARRPRPPRPPRPPRCVCAAKLQLKPPTLGAELEEEPLTEPACMCVLPPVCLRVRNISLSTLGTTNRLWSWRGREGLLGVTWAYGRYFPFIERGVPCYNHPNRLGFGIGIGIGLALVFTKFHANRKRFDESTTQIHTIGRCQCPLVGTLFA